MARIFTDGAEGGHLLFWNSVVSNVTASTAQKRSGAYSYLLTGNGATATRNNGGSDIFLRFGLYIVQCSTERTLLRLRAGTTIIADLRYEPTAAVLKTYINNSLIDTASISLALATWARVELRYKMDDAAGIYDLRIDGVTVAEFTGDTKPGADTEIDNIIFLSNTSFDFYIDDLAMNDSTGGVDDSWCGQGRVLVGKLPTGDGATVQWVNSAGNQVNMYDYVDNIPAGAQYITSGAPGEVNLFTGSSADLTGFTVRRLWTEAVALDTVGGADLGLLVRTDAINYKTTRNLTASQSRQVSNAYATVPGSGGAWNQAALDALQIGVETE
jgi:hypothetical protein